MWACMAFWLSDAAFMMPAAARRSPCRQPPAHRKVSEPRRMLSRHALSLGGATLPLLKQDLRPAHTSCRRGASSQIMLISPLKPEAAKYFSDGTEGLASNAHPPVHQAPDAPSTSKRFAAQATTNATRSSATWCQHCAPTKYSGDVSTRKGSLPAEGHTPCRRPAAPWRRTCRCTSRPAAWISFQTLPIGTHRAASRLSTHQRHRFANGLRGCEAYCPRLSTLERENRRGIRPRRSMPDSPRLWTYVARGSAAQLTRYTSPLSSRHSLAVLTHPCPRWSGDRQRLLRCCDSSTSSFTARPHLSSCCSCIYCGADCLLWLRGLGAAAHGPAICQTAECHQQEVHRRAAQPVRCVAVCARGHHIAGAERAAIVFLVCTLPSASIHVEHARRLTLVSLWRPSQVLGPGPFRWVCRLTPVTPPMCSNCVSSAIS